MSVEQTLSSMAYRQLTQNMPGMSSYLLGFELITNNDDNTFALGVNVALIGDTYVFIPTILKNGRIAPVDLMYVPELDQFLPCKDAWITYIQSKKTDLVATLNKKKNHIAGTAAAVDLDMPFDNFTKVASAGLKDLLKYASATMVDALCSTPDSCDIPCVEDLIDLAGINGLKKLASYIESTDGYNNMVEFYSDADMAKIIDKLNTRIKDESTQHDIGSAGEVKILTSASTEARNLSQDDKVRILRDGAVIKDTRGLTPSIVYKEKTNSEWCTPSKDGFYELLKIDGTTLTAYVFNKNTLRCNEETNKLHTDKNFYVVPLDDAQSRQAYEVSKDIVGQPYADTQKVGLTGKPISTIMNNSDYEFIIIDAKGNAIMAYIPKGDIASTPIYKDDEIIIPCRVRVKSGNSNTFARNIPTYNESSLEGIIIGKAGAKIRTTNNFLRIGEDATFFTIGSIYKQDYPKSIKLLSTVESMLDSLKRRAGNLAVTIFKTENGVFLDSNIAKVANASDIEAEYTLVHDFAVHPDDAHQILCEVNKNYRHENNYIIKIAADTQIAVSAPELPADNIQTSSINLGPMSSMSDQDKEIINKAVQSGTKEVFDVSILRLLAEDDAPVQIINEWMPSLFTALDRVGRILYLCRAGESMQDAYGVDRVDSIEKKLRRQFNELGDIILTMLKGKIKDFDYLRNGEL